MLLKTNDGKYLSREWHRLREQAEINDNGFSDSDLEWLDLDPDNRNYGNTIVNPRTWEVKTDPADTRTRTGVKLYDVRKRPACGD